MSEINKSKKESAGLPKLKYVDHLIGIRTPQRPPKNNHILIYIHTYIYILKKKRKGSLLLLLLLLLFFSFPDIIKREELERKSMCR